MQPEGSKYTVIMEMWDYFGICPHSEGLGSLRVYSGRELVLFSSSTLIRQSIIDVLAAQREVLLLYSHVAPTCRWQWRTSRIRSAEETQIFMSIKTLI